MATQVSDTATISPPTSEYEKLMLEAQAALKELQEAQLEVKKRSEAASLLTKDLHDTEAKADRISKELDSDLSANVVNNIIEEVKHETNTDSCDSSSSVSGVILKEGSTDIDSLKQDISGLEKAYLDSKQTYQNSTTNSDEQFRSSVDDAIPLALPSFPTLSDTNPEVSLSILSASSVLQTEGYVEVAFSITGE